MACPPEGRPHNIIVRRRLIQRIAPPTRFCNSLGGIPISWLLTMGTHLVSVTQVEPEHPAALAKVRGDVRLA